ncbi:unnamed protein product [Bursaphelenchus okinawaensis]|uniref:NAD(P)H-hydrate epimerase n=1 Tax=Bursaphelenchus okinawaensis TaxID=465554 RepID=A0A811JR87_9BILA|nr:unnamed protein product [Bursaphelenchus okinawaensis]CAG9079826.1 unnamed protein product [Bursaphelenchus okinawaensis]
MIKKLIDQPLVTHVNVRDFGFKKMPESLKFLGQKEAAAIDKELFEDYGFSVDQLMELAGLSCAQAIHHNYGPCPVLVLAGPGNNGGDGLVCARHLRLFGFQPTILYPKPSKSQLMQNLVKQTTLMEIPYIEKLPEDVSSVYHLVVDAFFGFSFKPPLREPFGEMMDSIVKANATVFSIDIPSGWDVENGPPEDGTVKLLPKSMISLTAPKKCAKHFKGTHYLGGRFVPQALADKYELNLPDYPGSQGFMLLSHDKEH